MKQLSLIISATVLFAGPVFAAPIHDAAREGDLVGVRAQLDAGTDVNAEDRHGWTPLHHAAFKDQKESADFLITEGANVNAKARGNDYQFKRLYEYFDQQFMTEVVVKFNAEEYAKGNTGWTPLHAAASKGNLGIVKSQCHRASLLLLYPRGIVKILLIKEADPNLQDNKYYTPLHLACISQSKEVVELLLTKNVDINENNEFNYTPLHVASVSGDTKIVELLISNCAEITAKTFYGSTPLHVAALSGKPKVVEMLLSNGAEVNARFRPSLTKIKTPLDYVRRANVTKDVKNEIIDLLRKHGGKRGRELKIAGK